MGSSLDFLTGGNAASSANSSAQTFLDATPQMTGAMREPALAASSAAKGFASFLDLLAPPTSNDMVAPQPTDDAVGTGGGAFSPSNPVSTLARAGGAIDRPDLQPQSKGEHAVAATGQGVGSAFPLLPFGGVAGAVPLLLGGGAGGYGSYEGGQIGAGLGHPVIGSLLGGAAGGLLGGGIGNLGVRGFNAAAGNYGDIGQAYRLAGVPMRMTGDVSENPVLQSLQAFGMRAPGGAARTQGAAADTVQALGGSIEDTASQLGSSRTLQDAGTALQTSGKQWLGQFKTNSQTAWNAVDAAVGPTSPVSLNNTAALLGDMKAAGGGNAAAETFLKSGLAKQIDGIVTDAAKTGGAIPWQTAKAIRTRVGEYLENPALVADAGGAQAKRLWGSLSSDMGDTIASSPNPNAQNLFDLASSYTSQGHDFIDGVLSPIIKDGQTPEGAARTALSSAGNGGTNLAAIREQMPDAADELAAFKLRDMASANPGQQNAAGTATSPSSFLTDWNRLSPQAADALFPDQATRAKIGAQATISHGIRETASNLNHSGTAPTLLTYEMLNGLFERAPLGAAAGYASYGLPGAVAGGVGGAFGPMVPGMIASRIGANRLLAALMAAKGSGIGLPATGLLGDYGALQQQPSLLGLPPAPRQ